MANEEDELPGEDPNGPTSTPQHLINVNRRFTRGSPCSSADCTTCKDPEQDRHHAQDLSQALGSSSSKLKPAMPTALPNHRDMEELESLMKRYKLAVET